MARILALLTDGFGAPGGIAQYNRDLLNALASSPGTSYVLALPRVGAVTHSLPEKFRQVPAVPSRLRWSLTALAVSVSGRFDIIFCGHLYAAPLAAFLARLTGAGLWVQVHGIDAWSPPGRLIEAAVNRADLITAVSRYTRRRLLGWSNIVPQRVRVLPNTVSADYAARPRRSSLAEKYGLSDRKIILTVGRIERSDGYKGHDRIICALPAIVQRCPEVAYLIVGSGDDVGRLEAEAVRVGVRDRLVFAGQVHQDELPEHFALASVFAMPSTGEGFGIVFLEAARMGIAVIGGNRDGSADALADGAIGRLIDPECSEELIDAVVAALEGRQLAFSGGVERFCFSHFAAHVDALINQLHNQPRNMEGGRE